MRFALDAGLLIHYFYPMIYGNQGRSGAQRTTIVTAETVFAIAAAWILVFGGISTINAWLGTHMDTGTPARRFVLLGFVLVTYARMTAMITVLLKRNIGWEEAISVPFAFALYYVGFALLGGTRQIPFGPLDVAALLLFAIGGAINTTSELLRKRWKSIPSNQGKLYTGGLFRYSRHINYFGDIIWVSAWALFTRNPWSAIIPVFLFCMFAFSNVPLLDKHLARKYGSQFDAYRQRTKGLIPFLL